MATVVPPSSIPEVQLFNLQALEAPLCTRINGSPEDSRAHQCRASMEEVRASIHRYGTCCRVWNSLSKLCALEPSVHLCARNAVQSNVADFGLLSECFSDCKAGIAREQWE
jgi:hypothetical protein